VTKFFDLDQPLSQIKRMKFMHMRPHCLLLLPMTIAQYLGCRFCATPLHKCHHSTHSRFHWLGGAVGRSGSLTLAEARMFGEEQLVAIKRIGILTGGGDVPGLQRRNQERYLP
jgi:hypothetical protein